MTFNIAILGASGHLGRGLISELLSNGDLSKLEKELGQGKTISQMLGKL